MTVDRERSRREGSAQPDEHQLLPSAFEERAETENQWSRRISGSTGNVGMGAFGVDPAKAAVDIGDSSVSRARCSMGRGVYRERQWSGLERASSEGQASFMNLFRTTSTGYPSAADSSG